MPNITIVYSLPTRRSLSGPYAETDIDTVDSAKEVAAAIGGALVPVDEDHIEKILELSADCIVNLIDWTGLDLPLADRAFALLEKTGIPFTGATRENYLLTSDKVSMKKALDANHLPTPPWQVFSTGDESVREFTYPVIVKLALEHCSIGLDKNAVVNSAKELRVRVKERLGQFQQPVFAEEFLTGREFQITVLDGKVLPAAEIVYKTRGTEALLTYASRWDESSAEYNTSSVVLAKDPPREIEALSLKTYSALQYRDYMRLDLRMRGDDLYILEANSNPGLSHSADYGMTVSYTAAGMSFADFVWEIVASALRRKGKAG